MPTMTGDSTQITSSPAPTRTATSRRSRSSDAEALVADLTAGDIVNGKAPAGKIVYTHSNSAFCTLAAKARA